MADQAYHMLLVFGGGYTDETTEHWQCGVRMVVREGATSPPLSGALPGYDVDATTVSRSESHWDIVSTWRLVQGVLTFNPDDWLNDQVGPTLDAHFGGIISSKARLDYAKASPISSTGHVVEDRTALLTWTSSNPTGAATGDPLPIETSLATSWKTPQIGRRGRGRIYPPFMTTAALDGHGQASSTATAAQVAWGVALCEGFAYDVPTIDLPGFFVRPIVTGSPWDNYGVITSVNVGNVFDVQRRRRRQLPEVRATGAVSY